MVRQGSKDENLEKPGRQTKQNKEVPSCSASLPLTPLSCVSSRSSAASASSTAVFCTFKCASISLATGPVHEVI